MQNTATVSTWLTFTLCPCKAKIRNLEEKWHKSHAWCFILKLSLYAHSVNPLCLLQRLISFISGRKVVCLIEIKVIIFHACTRAATGSYTFPAYYLSKVSWLRNTLFPKLKVRKVPGIISSAAFLGVRGYLVFPACWSVSNSLNLRARLSLVPSGTAGNLRWGPRGDWRFEASLMIFKLWMAVNSGVCDPSCIAQTESNRSI